MMKFWTGEGPVRTTVWCWHGVLVDLFSLRSLFSWGVTLTIGNVHNLIFKKHI